MWRYYVLDEVTIRGLAQELGRHRVTVLRMFASMARAEPGIVERLKEKPPVLTNAAADTTPAYCEGAPVDYRRQGAGR